MFSQCYRSDDSFRTGKENVKLRKKIYIGEFCFKHIVACILVMTVPSIQKNLAQTKIFPNLNFSQSSTGLIRNLSPEQKSLTQFFFNGKLARNKVDSKKY